MINTSRKGWIIRGPFATSLVILLILALTVPVWAGADVVFTNGATITINDATTIGTANPYPSTIAVSGLMGTVTNVTVTLNNINHSFPDDFDILLVGPAGGNLILLSDVGGDADMYNTNITLDDAAAASLPDALKYGNGSFKPTNIGPGDTWPAPAPAPSANTTLSAAFNGTDPNGSWSLYVADDLGVDMGVIGNGWSLTVTTGMSSATTFTNGGTAIHGGDGARGRANPYPSTITSSGLTGAITDVNVTLTGVNHLNPDDLDIVLVGPSGKRILLLSDAGGTTDAVNVNVTFDDAGAAIIPDAGPLVTATVRPTNFGTGDTIPDLLPVPYPNSPTGGPATLASVFNGTEPNGTWSLYVVDDATTSAGNIMGGWSIDITAGGSYNAKRFTSSDFNNDGITDLTVFRPSDRTWYFRDSDDDAQSAYLQFGSSGDILVPGDYDGDRETDLAVFRPSNGTWYIVQSATSTLRQQAWGTSGDVPVPADFDGDGKLDLVVYRNGVWYILQSLTSTSRVVAWGAATGDLPQRGHFEGGASAAFAVYRPSEGNWYILNNAASSSRVVTYGNATDIPVPADYDGDGETDIAIYRDSSGDWFVLQSATDTSLGTHIGVSGDIPVPGDYDGDSRADLGVWRQSTGTWFISSSGTPPGAAAGRIENWGLPGDIAVPSTYTTTRTVP